MGSVAALALAILTPSEARGQAPVTSSPGEVISVTVRDGVTRSDEFHAAMQPEAALESLRGVLDGQPDRFDALWRAARETVNLGMLSDDRDRARDWYHDAVIFAERAVELEPDSAIAYEWLAIALGHLAPERNHRDAGAVEEGEAT